MSDIQSAELLGYVALQIMLKCTRLNKTQIAEILSDQNEPVSPRTVHAWTTGQTLSIAPTLKVEGQSRKEYGFDDLLSFLLAKILLRGFGSIPIPAKGVQTFIANWQNPEFLRGIDFAAKISGSILLTPSAEDAQELEVLFFADTGRLRVSVTAFVTARRPYFVIRLGPVIDELIHRLYRWVEGQPFEKKRLTAPEMNAAIRSAAHIKREIEKAEEVLK